MLLAEPEARYIVYPSWATSFSFKWDDLPALFADPIRSNYLDANDRWYIEHGVIRVGVHEVDFIAGCEGGGVIRAHVKRGENWVGYSIMNKEAAFSKPPGTRNLGEQINDVASVAYLELLPRNVRRGVGDGHKEYTCNVTIEHADGAEERCWWVLEIQNGVSIGRIDRWLATLSGGFGAEVAPDEHLPSIVEQVADKWHTPGTNTFRWYRVRSEQNGAGFHFATLTYVAFHLRAVAGPAVLSMHLVAVIQGKPNFRRFWGKRSRK